MNRIDSINFHDSIVLRIEYNDSLKYLTIGLRSSDNVLRSIIFQSVFGWDFSSFEVQNVLFDLKVFDYDKIPDYLFDEYDGLINFKNSVEKEKYCVSILDPSVGLGGFIISRGIVIQ